MRALKLSVANRSRIRNYIAYIGDARKIHDYALEAQTKSGVLSPAETAQIKIPPIILLLEAQFFILAVSLSRRSSL